jgi:hypothetical protein
LILKIENFGVTFPLIHEGVHTINIVDVITKREMCDRAISTCFGDLVLNTPHCTNHFDMSMSTSSSKSNLKETSPNE